nr:hypothetical protein [Tanacetum cinerariifolium]
LVFEFEKIRKFARLTLLVPQLSED